MEGIMHLFNAIHPITNDLMHHFERIIKHKTIKRKEHLLKAGDYCTEMCFIKKGLLRCYIKNSRKELVTWLLKEGDMATAVVSFHGGIRSDESIEALEDTEVYYITREELEEVYDTYDFFNRHGRILTIAYQVEGRRMYNAMLLLSAQERYQLLENSKSDLINRVPAKYLASYLGISEAYLSKIKAKRNGGKKNKV